ncbi:hypothetical protein ACJX0J_027707 [Zea mays]
MDQMKISLMHHASKYVDQDLKEESTYLVIGMTKVMGLVTKNGMFGMALQRRWCIGLVLVSNLMDSGSITGTVLEFMDMKLQVCSNIFHGTYWNLLILAEHYMHMNPTLCHMNKIQNNQHIKTLKFSCQHEDKVVYLIEELNYF